VPKRDFVSNREDPLRVVTSRARPWFDFSALAHPVWWGALALLIVNDNLLKGAGVLPGWLTGKLSDFAFLIVAPVLFAALLPCRLRARRTLAVTSIVGLYVAADLSPPVSDAIVAAAARLGMAWRLWPDPTDLVALAILPVTFRLLRGPAVRTSVDREPWRARVGVVMGAVACLATSAPHMVEYAPFLLNRTESTADVRITWVLARVDCATTPEALAATLNPGDLDDPRQVSLVRGQVAALDGPPLAGESPVGRCTTRWTHTDACVAAILEAPAARPVLMVAPAQWSVPGDTPSRCQPSLDPAIEPGAQAVSLALVGAESRFVVSDTGATAKIKIAAIDPGAVAARPTTADGCRPTRDAYRTLLGGSACQSNADCRAVGGIVLPGEPSGDPALCVYLNVGAATEVESLARTWSDRCLSEAWSCQGALPVACVAGVCTPVCKGREVPYCPASCRHYPMVDFSEGKSCNTNVECLVDDGRRCICAAAPGASIGVVTCALDAPIALDCPIACRDSSAFYRDDAGPSGVDAATDGNADR
jgi:hypothetical protein